MGGDERPTSKGEGPRYRTTAEQEQRLRHPDPRFGERHSLMNSAPIIHMTPIDEGARFVRMAAHAWEELAAFYDINETMLTRRERRRLSLALTLLDRFARGCHGG